MNYSKKLIIGLAVIVIFSIVGLNMNALASTVENPFGNTTFSGNVVDTDDSTNGIEKVNTVKNDNNVANNTTPGELANTGLEDLPYLVIVLLVASAIFAYKKVKEYRAY